MKSVDEVKMCTGGREWGRVIVMAGDPRQKGALPSEGSACAHVKEKVLNFNATSLTHHHGLCRTQVTSVYI